MKRMKGMKIMKKIKELIVKNEGNERMNSE
jgi:hypothetical protein